MSHDYADNREHLRASAARALDALAMLETHDDESTRRRAVDALRVLESEAREHAAKVRALPPPGDAP